MGKDGSARWAGGGGGEGDGEGDGDWTTGLGLGDGEVVGVAAACCCGAAHETINSVMSVPAAQRNVKTNAD